MPASYFPREPCITCVRIQSAALFRSFGWGPLLTSFGANQSCAIPVDNVRGPGIYLVPLARVSLFRSALLLLISHDRMVRKRINSETSVRESSTMG